MQSRITSIHGRRRLYRLPTNDELANIKLVDITEFELSDKELRQLRTHLYAINRDGIRRYRTLREGTVVLVWRIK